MTVPPSTPKRSAKAFTMTVSAACLLSCATPSPLAKRAEVAGRTGWRECSDESLLARYIAIDARHLLRCSARNPAASAFRRVLNRDAGGAEDLASAAVGMRDLATRRRVLALAVAQLENAYRFGDAAALADRSGQADLTDEFTRAYARFPSPAADVPANVVEIAYDNLRIPATLDGVPVTIALDTGAPGIGVSPELVGRLGYPVDRSVSRISNVPAFKLSFPVFPVMLKELRIGSAVLRNLPANVGEVPPEQLAALRRMQGSAPAFDIIMGLDAFANVFDAIEFDIDRKQLRLIRQDRTPRKPANYILGSGAKPVVRLGLKSPGNVYVDTGAYGHLLGPDAFGTDECKAVRRYDRPWGKFEEYLIRARFAGTDPVEIWASRRPFGGDPAFDVTGVFGIPRSGVLRIDMEDRAISLDGYDVGAVNYDYLPTSVTPIRKGERCF